MILRVLNCESAFSFIETEFDEGRINDATLQSAADLIEECDLNLKVQSVEAWLDERYGEAERSGTLTVHSVHDLGDTLASVGMGTENRSAPLTARSANEEPRRCMGISLVGDSTRASRQPQA